MTIAMKSSTNSPNRLENACNKSRSTLSFNGKSFKNRTNCAWISRSLGIIADVRFLDASSRDSVHWLGGAGEFMPLRLYDIIEGEPDAWARVGSGGGLLSAFTNGEGPRAVSAHGALLLPVTRTGEDDANVLVVPYSDPALDACTGFGATI